MPYDKLLICTTCIPVFSFFSLLTSFNLPAAIEDLSGEQVPKSVLEKAASLREKGGLGSIDHLMQSLPDLLNRNREILDEVWCAMFINIEVL